MAARSTHLVGELLDGKRDGPVGTVGRARWVGMGGNCKHEANLGSAVANNVSTREVTTRSTCCGQMYQFCSLILHYQRWRLSLFSQLAVVHRNSEQVPTGGLAAQHKSQPYRREHVEDTVGLSARHQIVEGR